MSVATGRRRSVGFSYEGLTENACRALADFPEQPPIEVVCGIGRGVMSDPVQHAVCGHRYCRGCITEMLKSSQRCPAGNCEALIMSEDTLVPMITAQQRISELVSYCKERMKGCEWQGTPSEYEEHATVCKRSLPITCSMCRMRVPRDRMSTHITVDCPRLPARCEYCDWQGLAAELSHHLYHDCTEVPPERVPAEAPPTPPRSASAASPQPAPSPRPCDEINVHSPGGSILRQPKSAWGETTSPKAASLPVNTRELDVRKIQSKMDSGDLKGLRRRSSGGHSSPTKEGGRRGSGVALLIQ
eukprot:Hpha_TRINITY_DN4777_c0_g1::TRINITY_DN4777_c0_g1_i1::g.130566::m.130566